MGHAEGAALRKAVNDALDGLVAAHGPEDRAAARHEAAKAARYWSERASMPEGLPEPDSTRETLEIVIKPRTVTIPIPSMVARCLGCGELSDLCPGCNGTNGKSR